MIVNKRIDYTKLAYEADRISSSGHVAYWTSGRQETVAIMVEDTIVESFKQIAGLLGYRVEKIEQPVEAPEAAE